MPTKRINLSRKYLEHLYLKEKLSLCKIAKLLNCHPYQIKSLLLKYKVKIRSRREAIIVQKGILTNKKQLRNLYIQKNLSIYQIAPILKCHPTTVAEKLKEYGINIKSPQQKIIIGKKDLKKMYLKQKMSTYKIAEKLGCCVHTVTKRMVQNNIKRRQRTKISISKNSLEYLYNIKKLSLKDIGEIYKINTVTVLKRMQEHNIKRRTSWKLKYERKPYNGSLKDKAYLIGFRLGDLYVCWHSKRAGSIRFSSSTTKKEQVNLICNLFSKHSHMWLSKSNNGKVTTVDGSLDSSFSFLVKKQDNIEKWIRQNNKYMTAFIAGYVDAEGNIGIYGNRARFRLGSYDQQILTHIHKWLLSQNIHSLLRIDTKKGTRIGKNKTPLRKDFWRITVNDVNSLTKIFYLLRNDLKHRKRKNDMYKAIENIKLRLKNGTIQLYEKPYIYYQRNPLC